MDFDDRHVTRTRSSATRIVDMTSTGGIYIGLGSNLGDRERHLWDALRELASQGDVRVLACSSLHETDPVGGPPDQPRFLNAVAELESRLTPDELLARLHAIEDRHGRVRAVANGPRTLDLDLLLYRDQVRRAPALHVPHPRMWQRDFVLRPLAEICPPEKLAAARRLADGPESEPAHVR
jgi:2-amino-4-hydroxy-6-hydroxymethyldihydropteridine diphosphokinase